MTDPGQRKVIVNVIYSLSFIPMFLSLLGDAQVVKRPVKFSELDATNQIWHALDGFISNETLSVPLEVIFLVGALLRTPSSPESGTQRGRRRYTDGQHYRSLMRLYLYLHVSKSRLGK